MPPCRGRCVNEILHVFPGVPIWPIDQMPPPLPGSQLNEESLLMLERVGQFLKIMNCDAP